MNIFVFVKRVPDTESRIRIQHETRTIAEDGLNFVISPYDEYAVEEALRLKEAKGGTVRVVSVGRDETVDHPPQVPGHGRRRGPPRQGRLPGDL